MKMCPWSMSGHDEIMPSYDADHRLPERAAEMVPDRMVGDMRYGSVAMPT